MMATPCLNTVQAEFMQSVTSMNPVGEVRYASM